jgi:hypothetical protein
MRYFFTLEQITQLTALGQIWSGRRDSNPRPRAWKARALPLSYSRSRPILPKPNLHKPSLRKLVERGGFEPPKTLVGRFTVCSLWPLGNLSSLLCVSVITPGTSRAADGEGRTRDLLITSQLLFQLSYIGPEPETHVSIKPRAPCQPNSTPGSTLPPRGARLHFLHAVRRLALAAPRGPPSERSSQTHLLAAPSDSLALPPGGGRAPLIQNLNAAPGGGRVREARSQ